jgi:hypothetical protein
VVALLGLVACATTTTTPVSRQADPAFARKVVTYPTPVPAGTIVIDPGIIPMPQREALGYDPLTKSHKPREVCCKSAGLSLRANFTKATL